MRVVTGCFDHTLFSLLNFPKGFCMAKEKEVMVSGTTKSTVKWDDSDLHTSYADVCNVSCTREEVTILFGISHARQVGQKG